MFGAAKRNIPEVDGSGNSNDFDMEFNASLAIGDNTLRTPAAGKMLRIWRIKGLSGSAAVFRLLDGSGGTAVGRDNVVANGRVDFDFTPDGCDLTPGNALVLNSSATATVHLTITGREG